MEKKVNEKQVNQIVRALRSGNLNLNHFETLSKKKGRSSNEETIQAIVIGLKDAERASLSSKVVWR
jgi:hypothetical protein